MTTTTEVDLSVQDIARLTNLSPRQINNYRAAAEARMGLKFGYKQGRVTFFRPEEVREILKSRDSNYAGNPGSSQNYREACDFSNTNTQAEESSINGMEGIIAAGDQKAIAIGQAIGQRFVQTMWTTALSTMQQGLFDIGGQFDEIHSAIALPLNHQPQLPGSDPGSPRLEGDI